MKKTRECYKLIKMMKKNHGTAIILSLVIVSVLFILTSFLVRKVLTNTTMVEKIGEEQESYALAKQGILYALDQLNTWDGADPDYDPTDWTPNEVEQGNWSDYSNYSLMVYKDHIPTSGGYTEEEGYTTIESRDLPKKLVTLQAIAENTSPLLNYLRFINSDTTFQDNTFDEAGEGSLIEGEAPFSILGNVTWESGSSNNLTLSNSDSKAIIYGNISNGGVNSLKINNHNSQQGYYYFFDPDDSSYDDPALFDTADGHYFSSAHLPSCYDYSEPGSSPAYYYGGPQSVSWPEIKETRYQNLASGTNCYLDNDTEINKKTEWANPGSDNTSNDNDIEDEWFQDTAGSASYHYYPYAARLVLNTTSISQELSDGTVNTIDYSSITNNIIYAEGDISVSGIIPDGKQLTFVSGGNIFVDSNLLKEANSVSLALLAKKNIVLNPTIRYGTRTDNYSSNYPWENNPDASLGNADGIYAYPGSGIISLEPAGANPKTYTLDMDLGRLVTGGRIVLWDYQDGDGGQIKTSLQVLVTRDDPPPAESTNWDQVLPFTDVDDTYHVDFTPQTFRWIRLDLEIRNDHPSQPQDFDLSTEYFDAIEVPIYAVDTVLFAEEGSLKVVTGGGVAQDESILPNNNAYEPESTGGLKIPGDSGTSSQRLFFWGTLAETEWTGSVSGWYYLAYVYDPNLSSNPPPSLPPSVNLVSLKRK